jgi:hypothetical protein
MAFLTIATHGNRFRLISAVFGAALFATRCHRLRPLCSINAPSRVVGLGYAEGAMLSRPAAVSLASRRLRKWGREGGTRRGRSERPCSAYARSSSMRRRTLRCASAASRRTGSGTSAVDPRNPRERRTRWLRIGGSIEIRSRTPAWIAARAAPVRGRRSGVLAQPRARRKDHDRLAPAREASRCRDCAARFVPPRAGNAPSDRTSRPSSGRSKSWTFAMLRNARG